MSTLVVDRDESNIPRPIIDKLRSVVARARTVIFVRGLLAVIGIALLALLTGMAIDACFTIFSVPLRAAISIGLLSVVVAALYFFLVRPLSRSFNMVGVARIIEQRHPELEERISSAVELLSSKDVDEIRGSKVLIAEVAKQATGQVVAVSPQKEFNFAPARPYLIVAAIAAAILGLLFALWPGATSRVFNRVIAPFANIGNVKAADLTIEPGDITIAAGESLRIELSVNNDRVQSARLRQRSQGGLETVQRMNLIESSNSNPEFFLSIPAVSESFEYRVHAGGGLSRYYRVDVVPRPKIEEYQVAYEFPTYLGRDRAEFTTDTPNVEAPLGTQVTISTQTNTQITQAFLAIPGLTQYAAEITTNSATGLSTCQWRITLTDDYLVQRNWQIRLEDEHGFKNWPVDYTMQSIPDRAPRITIIDPSEMRQRRKRFDTLPIRYRVDEDFGVASVELVSSVDGGDETARRLSLPEKAKRGSFLSVTQLLLADIAPEGAQTIKVHLRVTDTLPQSLDGPHVAASNLLIITLDEAAQLYLQEVAGQDYASIREALNRTLAVLEQAETGSNVLENTVAVEGSLNQQTTDKINEVRDRAAEAQRELMQLAEILPQTAFQPLALPVQELAATDVNSAREQTDLIKLTDTANDRKQVAEQADAHLEKSIERTKDLISQLDKMWDQIKAIAELQELADRQEAVAHELANNEPTELAQLPTAKEQQQISKDISDLLKLTPDALEKLVEQNRQQAKDLAKELADLSDQQDSLATATQESNRPKQDMEQLREKLAAEIGKQQAQIAQEAADLDKDLEEANRAGDDHQSNLTQKPQQASAEIEKGDLAQAAEKATAAAKQLQQAADALAEHHDAPDTAADEQVAANDAAAQNANAEQMNADQAKAEQANKAGANPADASADQAKNAEANPAEANTDQAKNADANPADANENAGNENAGDENAAKPDPKQSDADANAGEQNAAPAENGENDPNANDPNAIDPNANQQKPTPQRDAQLAAQAGELAERQQRVADQLDALQKGDIDSAIEQMQQQVTEQTDALTEEAEMLAQLLQLLDQPNKANSFAQRATQQLEQAKQQTELASEQLNEANADTGKKVEAQTAAQAAQEANNADANAAEAGNAPNGDEPQQANAEQPQAQENAAQNGEAENAADAAAEAGPAFAQANQQNKNRAAGSQKQAARSLDQAAQSLEQLAQHMQAPQTNAPAAALAGLEEIGEMLAEALNAAAETNEALQESAQASAAQPANAASPEQAAAQAQAQASQAQAAQSAQKAAQALNEAAQAVKQQTGLAQEVGEADNATSQAQQDAPQTAPSDSAQQDESGKNQSQNKSQQASNNPASESNEGRQPETMDNDLEQKLKEYGITAEDWTRLPGNLQNQIRQAEADGVPQEYRTLVRRYFRQLARQTSQKEEAGANK